MQTETNSPVGHPVLRLQDIDPSKSPAFSPNLHAWMRKKGHFYQDGGSAQTLFKVREGSRAAEQYGADTLFIGYKSNQHPLDHDFIGVRLLQALSYGAKTDRWCYPAISPDMDEVVGFWDRYLEVGRCAIDPNHTTGFMGDRYSFVGDIRTCLWCGAAHQRLLKERVVLDESWVSV